MPARSIKLATVARNCGRFGLGWLVGQGHVWFSNELLPRLKSYRQSAVSDAIASDLFSYVGDVYLCCHAFKEARRYYAASVRLDPTQVWTVLDLADTHWFLGSHAAAKAAAKRAELVSPADRAVSMHVQSIREVKPPTPTRGKRVVRHAMGLLIAGQTRKALACVRGKRSLEALRVRALVSLSQGEIEQSIELFGRMSMHSEYYGLSGFDWFFVPDSVWLDAAFWRGLSAIGTRMNGIGLNFEGLEGSTKGRTIRQQVVQESQLALRFHCARTAADTRELAKDRPRNYFRMWTVGVHWL